MRCLRIGQIVTSMLPTGGTITMRRLLCTPTQVLLQDATTHGFQCSACGKPFRHLNALNHHIATRHAGQAKALSVGSDGKTSDASSTKTATATPVSPPPRASPSSSSTATGGASMPASSGFPGLFPGAATTVRPAASPASPLSASASPSLSTSPSSVAADDASSGSSAGQFVCTICQKVFRLEAALQHHYQAKHGMEMPSASSSTAASGGGTGGTTAVAGASALRGAFGLSMDAVGNRADGAGGSDGGAAGASSTQYTHVGEGVMPHFPNYHLDVAPNCPEDGDLAVHWRLVNHCVLLGTVSELQDGYVFEDRVLQFVVATDFENPCPGDPDKDFHTVRLSGTEQAITHWKETLRAGDRVMVSGRLRLVPQFDTATNKYYHHPVVMVPEGSGSVSKM